MSGTAYREDGHRTLSLSGDRGRVAYTFPHPLDLPPDDPGAYWEMALDSIHCPCMHSIHSVRAYLGVILYPTLPGQSFYAVRHRVLTHCDLTEPREICYILNNTHMRLSRYPGPKDQTMCRLEDIVRFDVETTQDGTRYYLSWQGFPRIGAVRIRFDAFLQRLLGAPVSCRLSPLTLQRTLDASPPSTFQPTYNIILYSPHIRPSRLGDADAPYLAVCPMRKRRNAFAKSKSPWFLACTMTYYPVYKRLVPKRLHDIQLELRDASGVLLDYTGPIYLQVHLRWKCPTPLAYT